MYQTMNKEAFKQQLVLSLCKEAGKYLLHGDKHQPGYIANKINQTADEIVGDYMADECFPPHIKEPMTLQKIKDTIGKRGGNNSLCRTVEIQPNEFYKLDDEEKLDHLSDLICAEGFLDEMSYKIVGNTHVSLFIKVWGKWLPDQDEQS